MASTVNVADPTPAVAPLAPSLASGPTPLVASLKAEGKQADLSSSLAASNQPAAASTAELQGIKARSEAAAAVKTAALARQRDAKTDRMVEKLHVGDEQLADLLSQAADSLSALLPRRPDSRIQDSGVQNDPNDQEETDAEAFEKKAQDWFAALNDVQTNMRAAVSHLRQANIPPLTTNASAASRARGQLGSAERGTDLRLLSSFINTGSSSSSGAAAASTSAKPAAPAAAGTEKPEMTSLTSSFSSAPRGKSGAKTPQSHANDPQRTPVGSIGGQSVGSSSRTGYFDDAADSASLSVSALRLQERGWKGLSRALEDIDLQRRVEKGVGASKMARVDSQPSRSGSSAKGKGRGGLSASPAPGSPNGKRNADTAEEEEDESSEEEQRLRMQREADQAADKIMGRKTTSDTRLLEALFRSNGISSALQQAQKSNSKR